MKITIQDCPAGEEEEIILRCRSVDDQLLKAIYALKAGREKLTVSQNDKIFQIDPKEVYYFEAVDGKVFVYLEKDVYDSKYRLYELEEMFQNTDFFRCTKSTIIHLAKVRNFTPSFNGRFEATMKNGEKLMISRQYVPELKAKLGLA